MDDDTSGIDTHGDASEHSPGYTNTVEIPLKDSEQVIELNLDELPLADEVQNILKNEQATLDVWIKIAEGYYCKGNHDDFASILELARSEASLMYANQEQDQMVCLDKLAAYYVEKAKTEKDAKIKDELRAQATQLYTMADKINMYNPSHLLGRACFCFQDPNKIDQAEQQFAFVLEQDKHNIQAMLGKAAIAYEKKDYKGSVKWYRQALRTDPSSKDPSVRLGLGICYYKLNKMDKARQAFNRALDFDPRCIGALTGLAVLELNTKLESNEGKSIQGSVRSGIQLFSKVYAIDNHNPLALVHLAEHFFYKNEFNRCVQLATVAIKSTDMDEIKAEAYYQLGRSFHKQGDYENAFNYYYKSTNLASECYPTFVLPFYGLGQLLIYRAERVNSKESDRIDYMNRAIEAFETVLKHYPNNYESMKILGSLYRFFANFEAKTSEGKKEIKHNCDNAQKKALAYFKKIVLAQKAETDPEVFLWFQKYF